MELPRGAKRLALRVIMTALPTIIRSAAKKRKSVREHLRKGDCILQLGLRDGSLARHYVFHGADRWTVWIGQFMHMVGSADWTAHVPATRPRPNA